LILPIAGAFLTIPNYVDVLATCPTDVMLRSLGLGIIYGVGGLTFGLGIRYIGFSLNYAIAIGISAGLGTLFPLIWHPNDGFVWEIFEKFSTVPGQIVLAGILISLGGIAVCGWAGALRERSGGDSPSKYSLKVGVPLAITAGTLSAVFNFALLAGEPLADAAALAGASDLLKMNAIYPFSNGGAFITNFTWCVYLIVRNRTGSQFLRLPKKGIGTLGFYYLMGLLSGAFWYFQFFFYGMGHHHMGETYGFTSWALHMAMLILFSNVYGWLFREWQGVGTRPRRVLHLGMVVIVVATLIITYGNYLGETSAAGH
jgi:L-rhamnose-H+ transport protein